MALNPRRLSIPIPRSPRSSVRSPLTAQAQPEITSSPDSLRFFAEHDKNVLARDLVDTHVREIDSNATVDSACAVLVENDTKCVAITESPQSRTYVGLFDYSDVNAFLTLAATSHLVSEDEQQPRARAILEAAKQGKVPIRLCSDLSEKNPLVTLPSASSIVPLLEVFSRGKHRIVTQDADGNPTGILTDQRLIAWFMESAPRDTHMSAVLAQPISALGLVSETGPLEVVTCRASETVLDAMRRMSEEGVSSVAVLDTETDDLMAAVSVVDIGRLVAPSQSKKILTTELGQFVALIKAQKGYQDGEDRYPVFSVSPTSTLSHVMQKLIATDAHRVFITEESPLQPVKQSNLRGVVSIIDVLSVFARLAGIPDVDPARMRRHRRASSASSSRSRPSSIHSGVSIPEGERRAR